MIQHFLAQPPYIQALYATAFTWFMTALGAAGIYTFKPNNLKILDASLGFAAGVMLAASYWSLLAPAIELSEQSGQIKWLPPLIGFILGGVFLRVADMLVPHMHLGGKDKSKRKEGIKTKWEKTFLFIGAITLHNIPEGLAIGVAFGAVANGMDHASITGAVLLAFGIGIQNFPEGFAVSAPLHALGMSRKKSFFYGQLSAVVEPIAGVTGALLVFLMKPILPYALSFAAGAMIYVIIEDVIPESQKNNNSDLATIGAMVGFAFMMSLDVALG